MLPVTGGHQVGRVPQGRLLGLNWFQSPRIRMVTVTVTDLVTDLVTVMATGKETGIRHRT